jgi:hypothetical protein
MIWKIVLVVGILGVLLGLAGTGISAALPFLTEGRVDWDEGPIFGVIAGVLVLGVSFVIFLIGLIFVIKNRKKKTVVG